MAIVHKRDLSLDRKIWIGLMLFLSVISLTMLSRENNKHFGAIAYGGFPEFQAVAHDGQVFTQRALKARLSAIIISEKNVSSDLLIYLHKISQVTESGRKYLNAFILTDQQQGVSDKWVQYLTVNSIDLQKLKNWQESRFNGNVILVDQNGIIRGVFDLEDKLQRINFEAAVKAIL